MSTRAEELVKYIPVYLKTIRIETLQQIHEDRATKLK